MKKNLIITGCIAFLFLLVSLNSLGGTLFCPKSDVVGFEQQHQEGNLYVGSSTNNSRELEFYVTAKGNHLFLQSNYRPPDSDYPFKLTTDDNFNDLKFLAKNLLTFGGRLDLPSGFDAAYSKDAFLYYDIELLNHPKYKNLNLGKSNNGYFVDNNGGKWLFKTLDNQKYLEILPSISVNIPISNTQKSANFSTDIKQLIHNLNLPFDKKSLKLLPLVNDPDTQEAIANKLSSDNSINLESYSLDDFKKAFEANEGSKIFLLGHFDSQKKVFVATDEFDKTIAEFKFDELEKLAREFNVRLYPFGCETGKSHDSNGTLQKFNSVEAVNRLQPALNAPSWEEFFKSLGQDDLEFIVTNSFVEDGETIIDVDIIKGAGNGKPPRKGGHIRISTSDNGNSRIIVTSIPCSANSNSNSANSNCNSNSNKGGNSELIVKEWDGWSLSYWAFPLLVLAISIIGGTIGFILHKQT